MSGKSWLDEDPEWQELRTRIENGGAAKNPNSPKRKPSSSVKLRHHFKTSTVSKHITSRVRRLPGHIDKAHAPGKASNTEGVIKHSQQNTHTLFKALRNLPKVYLMGGITLLLFIIGSITFWPLSSESGQNAPLVDGSDVLSDQTQQPAYEVLSPREDSSAEKSNLLYDPNRKVASYTDKIGITPITVSMQPLPGAFAADPAVYVERLARDFYATDKINESNPIAFTGKNVNGVQTTLFSKKGLLVFIQAVEEVDRSDLAEYITLLE